jgi:uncharacterized protein YlxP (DUF503 family)
MLQARLHLGEAASLKDKRQVVKSILDRVRNRFSVAAAEVDDLDLHQTAVLGFAAVSNSVHHARQVVTNVLEFLRGHPVAAVVDHELEVL